MAVEMDELQQQFAIAIKERDQLLVDIQQLRDDLAAKDEQLLELQMKHDMFLKDYDSMQSLLNDIQVTLATKEEDLKVANAKVAEVESRPRENVTQVTIVSKESKIDPPVSNPQLRNRLRNPKLILVRTGGHTCYFLTVS